MSSTQNMNRKMHRPDPRAVMAAIEKRTFCNLATTSASGHPHVAGVIYQVVDGNLYLNTERDSRKGRNVTANSKVAVAIPVRRSPVGPPSSIQFQSRAEVLGIDDPEIVELAGAGKLDAITGHGELEHPDGCFVKIPLPTRLLTYGLGMSLLDLVRNPLDAAGVVELGRVD